MKMSLPQISKYPISPNDAADEHTYITPRLRHLVYAYFSRRLDMYDSVIDAAADAQQLLKQFEIKYKRKHDDELQRQRNK